RSRLRPQVDPADLHGHCAPHAAQPPARRARHQRSDITQPGELPMKGSRVTALGLVLASGLWIASGHFLPHESAESRAAVRSGGESEVKKLFRVAVAETVAVPHSRKLVLSGRTEADKRVVINTRTNGEVAEVRVKRGSI